MVPTDTLPTDTGTVQDGPRGGLFGHLPWPGRPRSTDPLPIEPTGRASDLPGLVGTALDNGTGATIGDPLGPVNAWHADPPFTGWHTDGSNGGATTDPTLPTADTSLPDAAAWANATNASAGNTAGVLAALQQSASNGGANMPLGPQLGFADITTSSTSGSSGGLSPIFFIGVAIVGVIIFLVWKHHKKSAE